ncbi:hypothetical protein BH23ACT11_BH23ACT11_00650 [soil metagenome]
MIRDHANQHSTLFERAERHGRRAERLKREGTPSDSAHNRAERAKHEVALELANLRASFLAQVNSPQSESAFDQEVDVLYSALGLGAGDSQIS